MHGTVFVLAEKGYKPDINEVLGSAQDYYTPELDYVDEMEEGFKPSELTRGMDFMKELGRVEGDTIYLTTQALSSYFLKGLELTGDKEADYIKFKSNERMIRMVVDPVIICTADGCIYCDWTLFDAVLKAYHNLSIYGGGPLEYCEYELNLVDCLDYHC